MARDDFKSGQTNMKSVLVDFLVSAGIKPVSIISYNHLGKNLSAPSQFRSKEISKSNVVDDMVASNRILFEEDEDPDHVVGIKYVPYVADSKRAMDEYTSEIFMAIVLRLVRSKQLFSTLRHLETRNVIHADIKWDNFLVSSEFSIVEFCDFGGRFS